MYLVKGERHERTSGHYTTLCATTSLDNLCSECLSIAQRTGFLKRLRKINPLLFLRALAITSFQAAPSFRLIALSLSLLSSQNITKQAVAKHMGRECVEFIRSAVSALIFKLSSADKLHHAGVFQSFRRVLLQDSTQIRLPDHLANYFPGPTNQNRNDGAALKIQVVYNLLDETFPYFGSQDLGGPTKRPQPISFRLQNPEIWWCATLVILQPRFFKNLLIGESISSPDSVKML